MIQQLSPALLFLALASAPAGPLAPLAGPAPQEEVPQDEAPQEEDEGTSPAAEGPTPVPAFPDLGVTDEEALKGSRALAKSWGTAAYRILIQRNKKRQVEVGIYVQNNSMGAIEGEQVLQCTDFLTMPKMQAEMSFRTICDANARARVRGVTGEIPTGKMRIEFEDGRAVGSNIGQTPVDSPIPELFLTKFSVLRGLHWLRFEEGWSATFPYLDIEKLPGERANSSGTMKCLGPVTLQIEGGEYPSWKFRWAQLEKEPIFVWFGEDGRMLKRQEKSEIWLWSPKITAKQIELEEERRTSRSKGR